MHYRSGPELLLLQPTLERNDTLGTYSKGDPGCLNVYKSCCIVEHETLDARRLQQFLPQTEIRLKSALPRESRKMGDLKSSGPCTENARNGRQQGGPEILRPKGPRGGTERERERSGKQNAEFRCFPCWMVGALFGPWILTYTEFHRAGVAFRSIPALTTNSDVPQDQQLHLFVN